MTDETITTDDRIVNLLREREAIILTASDLAERMGKARSTVYEHLRELEDEGRVDSIHVGRGRGWYLPGDRGGNTPQEYLIPTYHEYVRRPADGRGRVTVGAEYAGRFLTVAILDSPAVHTVEPGEWEYKTPLKYQRAAEVLEDLEADDRGRISIGRDWADQEISLAVLEVND